MEKIMGNEELNNNNSENNEFNFVQEKVKPKTKKRIKKVLAVTGLSILAGLIFGVVSRVAFLTMGDPVAKLLGIETEGREEPLEPTGTGKNEVRYPTNPATPTAEPTPTQKPTPTPQPTPPGSDITPAFEAS